MICLLSLSLCCFISTYTSLVAAEKIIVTGEHPFYLANQGWTTVKNMNQYNQIRTENGANKLASVHPCTQANNTVVYNFTVKKHHTYYVSSKKKPHQNLLAHNSCTKIIIVPIGNIAFRNHIYAGPNGGIGGTATGNTTGSINKEGFVLLNEGNHRAAKAMISAIAAGKTNIEVSIDVTFGSTHEWQEMVNFNEFVSEFPYVIPSHHANVLSSIPTELQIAITRGLVDPKELTSLSHILGDIPMFHARQHYQDHIGSDGMFIYEDDPSDLLIPPLTLSTNNFPRMHTFSNGKTAEIFSDQEILSIEENIKKQISAKGSVPPTTSSHNKAPWWKIW